MDSQLISIKDFINIHRMFIKEKVENFWCNEKQQNKWL